jgi:hypothetical protein
MENRVVRFFRWLLRWLDSLFLKAPAKPPIVEVARHMMKARGLPYDGEVFHTGELTEANNERARRRAQARQ